MRPRREGRSAASVRHRAGTERPPAISFWRKDLFVIATVSLATAIYRFAVLAGNPGPPGSDGGNWLAFTRDLFGTSTKSAESMYFPGMLVMLQTLMTFLPELVALKTLAVFASIAPAVPFYFLLRRICSQPASIVLTVLLLMTGYLIEMMAWGGYPQLYGTAFLLGVFYYLDRWLYEGVRRDLYYSAACVALIFATHHFTVVILFASLALYVPYVAFRQRAVFMAYARRIATWSAFAACLTLLTLPWYLRYLSLVSGDGSLNATSQGLTTLGEVLSYIYFEAPLTWVALSTLVPLLALLPGNESVSRVRAIGICLLVSSILVHALTREPRAFLPLQAGALICLGVLATHAAVFLEKMKERPALLLAGRLTVGMATLGLLMIILPNSHARFLQARDNYAAMDTQAVEALSWLRHRTEPGTVVLPSNRRGMVNYAWWVEGYGRRPAYGLVNANFLAFEEEKVQAAIAERIIDEATPADEARELIREAGIRYFFIYKPTGGDFQTLVERVPSTISFQNKDFVIFKVTDASAAAHE